MKTTLLFCTKGKSRVPSSQISLQHEDNLLDTTLFEPLRSVLLCVSPLFCVSVSTVLVIVSGPKMLCHPCVRSKTHSPLLVSISDPHVHHHLIRPVSYWTTKELKVYSWWSVPWRSSYVGVFPVICPYSVVGVVERSLDSNRRVIVTTLFSCSSVSLFEINP